MATSVNLIIFCSFLCLSISSSIAQTSFRPKALVLPVTKDESASAPQYVTQIHQRTPLVPVNLVVDVGGGYLWVNCEQNYVSSTKKPARCGSAQCSLFGNSGCSSEKICGRSPSNSVTGVASYGDIYSDVVSVQSTDGNNPGRNVTVPNFLFICGSNVVQEGFANGVTGMAGLGRTKVSLPSQFSAAFSFPRKFAICLSSSSQSTGAIIFGDAPYNFNGDLTTTLTYTPLIKNPVSTAVSAFSGEPSVEYFIGVKSIKIAGKTVPLNTTLLSIDTNGIGGTKISTVNPYTVMETTVYKAVSEAFVEALGVRTVSPVVPFGTCYSVNDISFSRMGPDVPAVDLVLQNEDVVWTIIGANSMVRVSSDVICLGFVDAGSNPNTLQVGFVAGGSHPMTSITIGAHQLENNLVQFDLATSRVGFRSVFLDHTNCANFNFTSNV